MYTEKTIAKFIALGKKLIKAFLAILVSVHVIISRGNRKIGRFMNVSLAPIFSCKNCSGCKKFCYDLKACLRYPLTMQARIKNYVLAVHDRDRYFGEIIARLIRKKRGLMGFRWHVGGDILDYDYFCRMVEIAKMFPNIDFWTYTKMYFFVNKYVAEHGGSKAAAIPQNLHVMFSVWYGMTIVNPYGFATFRCILKDGSCEKKRPDEMYCPGNCERCFKEKTGCIGEKNCCVNEH